MWSGFGGFSVKVVILVVISLFWSVCQGGWCLLSLFFVFLLLALCPFLYNACVLCCTILQALLKYSLYLPIEKKLSCKSRFART